MGARHSFGETVESRLAMEDPRPDRSRERTAAAHATPGGPTRAKSRFRRRQTGDSFRRFRPSHWWRVRRSGRVGRVARIGSLRSRQTAGRRRARRRVPLPVLPFDPVPDARDLEPPQVPAAAPGSADPVQDFGQFLSGLPQGAPDLASSAGGPVQVPGFFRLASNQSSRFLSSRSNPRSTGSQNTLPRSASGRWSWPEYASGLSWS